MVWYNTCRISKKGRELMVLEKIKLIFSNEEISRIRIDEQSEQQLSITVDVHGLKCSEARRLINNLINLLRMSFQLIIIHGYNHGTAIKDMLATNFSNSHIKERYPDCYNQGVTHILVA